MAWRCVLGARFFRGASLRLGFRMDGPRNPGSICTAAEVSGCWILQVRTKPDVCGIFLGLAGPLGRVRHSKLAGPHACARGGASGRSLCAALRRAYATQNVRSRLRSILQECLQVDSAPSRMEAVTALWSGQAIKARLGQGLCLRIYSK